MEDILIIKYKNKLELLVTFNEKCLIIDGVMLVKLEQKIM